jgi:predicted DNA-binding transcriptional regulator AlpA
LRPEVPRAKNEDHLLAPKQVAEFLGVHVASVWGAVAAGRLPPPFYPLPRTPRWCKDELRKAVERTRALPRDAMAARRAVSICARTSASVTPIDRAAKAG